MNTNLCTLMYWNDKYEQDLGKIPLGKYELSKCCQVSKDLVSIGNICGNNSNSYHNHYQQMTSNGNNNNNNNSFDFKLTVCDFLTFLKPLPHRAVLFCNFYRICGAIRFKFYIYIIKSLKLTLPGKKFGLLNQLF